MKFEVDDEFVDKLTRENIKQAIDCCISEIKQLSNKEKLLPHQKQDLKDIRKHLKHLVKTYNYFTAPSEHLDYEEILDFAENGFD
jgi:hypothetical protein